MDPITGGVVAAVAVGGAVSWIVARALRKRGPSSGVHEIIPVTGATGRGAVHYGTVRIGGRVVDYTEFAAQFPWTQGAMRISTADWCGPLDATFGARDVRIGQPEIDARYVIQGNPESLPKRALHEATLDRIWHIHSMGGDAFLLQLRAGHLMVRVSRRLEAGKRMQPFVEECFGIVAHLAGLPDPDMRVEPVEVKAEAECQVCGTAIEEAHRVFCRKCRTAHHEECWQYNDGCSTFACGERRFSKDQR